MVSILNPPQSHHRIDEAPRQDFMGECDKENSFAILDTFFEMGGNFIDTANNDQAEDSEKWLCEWMEKRGNRDQMV